ncbi:MAG: hypothetical protein HDT07_03010 [Bacteroidales bacterium]|nr:hypothetical protein [Bacteroidales bacterium]
MKLFKSSIFAVLGLVFAMTACSDDKNHPDYTPAGEAVGAYFPVHSSTMAPFREPGVYYAETGKSSLDIPLYRTKGAKDTYELTMEDPSGLFTAPTTVTFAGNELETPIVITYDPEKLVEGTYYPITLTVTNGSNYGQTTYSCKIYRGDPRRPLTDELASGNFFYTVFFSGDDPGLEVEVEYLPTTPNHQYYVIYHWGNDVTLEIDIPDISKVDKDGNTTVFVHPTYTGYDHATYGQVWVADYYSYYEEVVAVVNGTTARPDKNSSYFNVEKGLFSLDLMYYVPEYDPLSGFGHGYEFFQLDGFPNYEIGVTYDGIFLTKDGDMSVQATLSVGADTEEVRTVMVPGDDVEGALNLIAAKDESVQILDEVGEFTVSFPVEKGGDYTVVAATYGDGQIQEFSYDTFTVALSGANDGWENIGKGQMIDGWIIPQFVNGNQQQLQADEYPFAVTIQKSTEDPTLYRLVQPYGPTFPMAQYNEISAKRNIEIIITEGIGIITPQASGFGEAGDEFQIATYAGILLSNNPDASIADIKYTLEVRGLPLDEYYEDDKFLMVHDPYFTNGDKWYHFNNPQPAYITFPDASASVVAKLKAKSVASPSIAPFSRQIKAKADNIDTRMQVLKKETLKPSSFSLRNFK